MLECGLDACGTPCGECPGDLPCTGGVCSTCTARGGEAGCLDFGFEQNGLLGWTLAGAAHLVSALGEMTPLEGELMLLVTTGLASIQLGSVRFDTCLPESETDWALRFKFKFKFYSEEFVEYCGSQFQDGFVARLEAATDHVLLDLRIDALCLPTPRPGVPSVQSDQTV